MHKTITEIETKLEINKIINLNQTTFLNLKKRLITNTEKPLGVDTWQKTKN